MTTSIVPQARPYRPLYEDAYEALRDAILNGRLAPGARIVEAEIARQMAISRAPIREAIRKLERDGLVEYHARRGTVVVALSVDEVRDAYALRAHLETYAARLAVERATDDDFRRLEDSLQQMRERAASDDLRGLIAADVEFHRHILQSSGSKRVRHLWDGLNPHSWTLLTGVRATEYSLAQIAERHVPVLDALRLRDPNLAETAVRDHILELANTVLNHLTTEEGSASRRRSSSLPGGVVTEGGEPIGTPR